MKLSKQLKALLFAALLFMPNQKCLPMPEIAQKAWVTISQAPVRFLASSNNLLPTAGEEVNLLNGLYTNLWAQESATWWKLPWLWRMRSFSSITKEQVDLGSMVRSLSTSRNNISSALNLVDNRSVSSKQPWNALKLGRRFARWVNHNIIRNNPEKLSWKNPFNWLAKLINLPGEAGFDFSTGSRLHDSIAQNGISNGNQLDYALKLSKLKVDAIKNLDANLNNTPRLFGKGYEAIRKSHQAISKYKEAILSQHRALMWEKVKFILRSHPIMFWASAAVGTTATFGLYCLIMKMFITDNKYIAGGVATLATMASIYIMPSILMLPGVICMNPSLLIPRLS